MPTPSDVEKHVMAYLADGSLHGAKSRGRDGVCSKTLTIGGVRVNRMRLQVRFGTELHGFGQDLPPKAEKALRLAIQEAFRKHRRGSAGR